MCIKIIRGIDKCTAQSMNSYLFQISYLFQVNYLFKINYLSQVAC